MKNYLKLLSGAALVALCFTACSDEDSDWLNKELAGRWDYVHSTTKYSEYYDFAASGDYVYVETVNGRVYEESGKWNTKDGTLKLRSVEADGTTDSEELNYRISGETLYLWDLDEDQRMADVYKLHK